MVDYVHTVININISIHSNEFYFELLKHTFNDRKNLFGLAEHKELVRLALVVPFPDELV